jgi:colanic acid/amylovoran biosynthesis glycosyltransferase
MAIEEVKTKIAYLAPEIPALSATFVYNEILGLEKRGWEIVPISVHVPRSVAQEGKVRGIAARTRYLYREPGWRFIATNIGMLFRGPLRYPRAMFLALGDALRIGLTTHVGMGLLYRFWVASRVAAILKKENCRHLHVHFAHIPTDIAMYASVMSGVPFTFTSHANDLFERGWLLSQKVARARFAATISEHNRRFLMNQGAPAEKIHVIRCGVDAGAFASRPAKSLNEPPRLGTLGRMVEKKGFDTLVQACGFLNTQGNRFHLEIAGDGPLQNDLQERVRSLDLTTMISFLGPLPHDRVPEWLQSLDLFVLPCKKDTRGDMDGIPVVLMEAMLSGIPVISTRLSGIPELVEDENTGLLAQPDDPQELARAIVRLLTDESLRGKIQRNAVLKVQSQFDLLQNVEKLSNLFSKVAA